MRLQNRRPKLEQAELVGRVVSSVISGQYRILPHSRQRCTERDVSAPDIEFALQNGHPVPSRDRYDKLLKDWSYCFEGP